MSAALERAQFKVGLHRGDPCALLSGVDVGVALGAATRRARADDGPAGRQDSSEGFKWRRCPTARSRRREEGGVFTENAMGILGNILSKIFPSSHPANAPAPDTGAKPATPPVAPAGTPVAAAPTAPSAMTQVDVEAMLDGMAGKSNEKLNWKTSIVDLMKLLGLDSSLAARKELAQELHYSGDMNDSAGMNVWLHRQVMTKVAANGGKVPADLKD